MHLTLKKINLLPEFIINQIAAGEVIEGPYSIIKELFENSIDAQANVIDIKVSKNFSKIEITDNGHGIAAEDLELAFKKHATSKIQNLEDLETLMTNGFRGEALASISAISKLTCITKTSESDFAYKIYIENEKQEISKTGSGQGTKFIIDDLFFNTPVRLKFLKSNTKERNNIIDLVRGLSLANPQVKVSLSIDNKIILQSSGSNDIEKVLAEIFKLEKQNSLLQLDNSDGSIKVSGYCSKISNTRTDKRALFTIVNNRIVDCYIIKSAILSLYKELLPTGKYPIAVIKLDLPSTDIDVNIHPTKKEIKYAEANKIYRIVQNTIDQKLRNNSYQEIETFNQQNHLKENHLNTRQVSQTKINNDFFQENHYHQDEKQGNFQNQISNLESQKTFKNESSEETILFNSSKFLARIGSISIKKIDNTDVQTILSSLGNKTKYEYVVKDLAKNQAIVFSGEFIGENWLKEKVFAFLETIAVDIFAQDKKPQSAQTHSRPNKKPKQSTLEKIWQRDNYTCVYCAKPLLSPASVKHYLNENLDAKLVNQHLASYDHHLPASKFATLNEDENNLYAACQECNIKKSNSLASKTWEPQAYNSWDKALVIGETKIEKPELN